MLLLGVVAVLCLALWAQWSALTRYTGWVYWLEHAGTQLMLFMMFGRTLLAAQKPLCTRFAEIVHGANLTPQYRAYTRQVTLAWSVFFATIALMSSVLFFLTPLTTWSIFANFVTGPLVILMFVVEYAVRIRVRPEMRHHILDAVRAFRGDMAHPR